MRKMRIMLIVCCVMIFPVFSAHAAGKTAIDLKAQAGRADYSFSIPDEQFVLLKFTAPKESGQEVIYGENGNFSGTISLPYSREGGKVKVTVETLKGYGKGEANADLIADATYTTPLGQSQGKIPALTLEELPTGFSYDFYAPGTDFLQLFFKCKQQSGSFFIFPEDGSGHYSGRVELPLTYARTLVTVQVQSLKGKVLAKGEVRKGYLAPQAPEKGKGRLSGITVCVDPGHQENGRMVTEPMGPGLPGATSGTGGSAQGKITLRREAIVTLEIGIALRDELLRQGANVVMTRETQDVFHTNIERCEIAKEGNADIMLRLHCDLVENKNKRGISVYGPLNSDYARQVADPTLYRQMGELLINAMKRSVGYELTDKTGYVKLGDGFVGNNWAQMPCFLIEMGYMSNVQDDYLLSQPVYQQWLAEGMTQGVYEIAVLRNWIAEE